MNKNLIQYMSDAELKEYVELYGGLEGEVIIHVKNGVATVFSKPDNVSVSIIDYDDSIDVPIVEMPSLDV